MKKVMCVRLMVTAIAIAGSSIAHANGTGNNLVYVGAGSGKSDNAFASDDKPMSFGYLRLSNVNDAVWGVDIGREGTRLDSTWGRDQSIRQGTSFNLLIGRNLANNEGARLDAGLLVGAREKSSECPSSYLGYQCYADSEPETSYGVNYGFMLTATYKSFMLGFRATGESKQASLGIRF